MKLTTWEDQRDTLRTTVAFVGGSRRRAFNAVVIQIDNFSPTKPKRSIVLKTSGTQHPEIDKVRLQRLCRRLRAVGVKFTSDAAFHPNNGMGGTVFGCTG